MARTNRVIVSPGVYTSEKELSFVSQSIGITTLGMVGETLKGPAFEPVLIGSFDEFRTYFGGTSSEKFGDGNPKYELPFFAKSYLQESSQLFVTRVLGLTGYKPKFSWVISTVAASGTTASAYAGKAVAMIRSRGSYSGVTAPLNLEVSTSGGLTLANTPGDMTTNPFADFTLSAGGKDFVCSLDKTAKTFISKVIGTSTFDRDLTDFPFYVHEEYSNWLKNAWDFGYVTGLSASLIYEDEFSNYVAEWSTAQTPWIVTEVRGGKVTNLFRFISVPDGNAANFETKVSITNINLQTLEFDVLVRDYYDTDDQPVVLEKFTRCSMNPSVPGYVGKKIGSSDGTYELKSKFVMIELEQDHPTDAIPAGFLGYPYKMVSTGSTVGVAAYKLRYYQAGDVMGRDTLGNDIISTGDKIRKHYLGFSTQVKADDSLLVYKGEDVEGLTRGFHMSIQASGITDSNSNLMFETSPDNFEAGAGNFDELNACKFTIKFYGGFDGWDIYRDTRTNTNDYVVGRLGYISGDTAHNGVFFVTVDPAEGNSDFYAFQQAINVYSNAEAITINAFATAGINFFDHSRLVADTIDMIEVDRADSIYVVNAPNRDTVEQVIDDLDTLEIDSNYTSTFFPWIQVKDSDNSTQLYVPPTGEVLRSMAFTDNATFPWFAPAGYNRGRVTAQKARIKLTLDQRDDLYKNRINPIATFADVGPIIWGNRTLQIHESPLDRINVRRLLLQARKLIAAVALRLVFEQNDDLPRNEFERMVNPILQSIKNDRGLTDFRVRVSHAPEDIDKQTLKATLYLKPTKALEFIEIDFVVTPTGASFENI